MSEENSTPQTVQTVQDQGSVKEPWFEIAEVQGEWHWVLWSGNGRMVARNAIAYYTRQDVIQAIKAMQKCAKSARLICKGT